MKWNNETPIEMKFRKGDTVFRFWINNAIDVEIIGVYTNTGRYKVVEKYADNRREYFLDMEEVFATAEECIKNQIEKIEKEVSCLSEKNRKLGLLLGGKE